MYLASATNHTPGDTRHWLLGVITSTSWDRRCSSIPTSLQSLTMAGGWHSWLVGPCFRREMPRGWTTRLSMQRQRTTIGVGVSHVDGGRRLSYASFPAIDADLPQTHASSQPIFEATICFDENTTDAYIQEADETT
uniref:Uncharacterized protein n=1 Tax=Nicotiana tabacum TaxID=4097 RepID=A0A1S3X9F5_TOBAC